MLLTAGAIAALTAASIGAGLVSSAADAAHNRANREDTQEFNSQEAALQRDWQSQENATARAFNAVEAQKQRDFEKYLSDTSYQRQRADLEAAGYNPASIGITQGASSPSGAVASGAPVGSAYAASSNTGYNARMNLGQSYFANLMSSAIQYQMSKDRDFTNQMIAKMYTTNAADMNKLRVAVKQAFNSSYDYRTDEWKKKDLSSGKYDKIFNGFESL